MTDPQHLGNGVAQQEWTATVVGHHRLRHDVAVIRLIGEFVPFVAGQSVEIRTQRHPGVRRRLSPRCRRRWTGSWSSTCGRCRVGG